MAAGFIYRPTEAFTFSVSALTSEGVEEVVKLYTIRAEREEVLRDMIREGKNVFDKGQQLADGEFDQFVETLKTYIEKVFGAGEFDFLYARFDRNFFAMVMLIGAFSEQCLAYLKEKMLTKAAKYD